MAEKIPVAGQEQPIQFAQVFQVVGVQCDNCKQGLIPNQAMFAELSELVPIVGAAIHGQIVTASKVICASPRLMITTALVFMDTRLMDKASAPIKGV